MHDQEIERPHITMLKAEFESRRSRNAAYSLRSFSRDLTLPPSVLSELLRGRKGISRQRAEVLAQKINLSPSETDLFLLSAEACHSRAKRMRAEALEGLNAVLRENQVTHQITLKEVELLQNWYHQAIMELTELPDCDSTAEWFAKRLNIPVEIAAGAIERLLNLKHLERQDGKLVAAFEASVTPVDISSRALKNLHSENLDRAKDALFVQPVEEREFTSATFAFDADQVAAAKKEIRDFQRKFARKFHSQSTNKNSVYQVAIQFFRLDHKGDSK